VEVRSGSGEWKQEVEVESGIGKWTWEVGVISLEEVGST
jgi:hypothetical protein